MDYVKDVFKRMDLNQICSFVLNGSEDFDAESATFKERLEKSDSVIYSLLESIYKDEDERDNAVADLSKALALREEVYTEIGMKLGARIIFQLLKTD